MAESFRDELKKSIIPVLENIPTPLGLTFGADVGDLVPFIMNGHTEYVGRPLNIASRLQAAVKEDTNPAYDPAFKMIISKPAFRALRLPSVYPREPIKRKLRNIIFEQEYECVRLAVSAAS